MAEPLKLTKKRMQEIALIVASAKLAECSGILRPGVTGEEALQRMSTMLFRILDQQATSFMKPCVLETVLAEKVSLSEVRAFFQTLLHQVVDNYFSNHRS